MSNESRRQQRYSKAEATLSTSLKHCKPEPTPEELQIRALEQVTALLSAHAKDAQERAVKLRGVLMDKDGDVDPKLYIQMQRERWMEEKRQGAVDNEVKAVKECIISLNRFGKSRPQAAGGMPKVVSKGEESEAKRRANLVKFFESSQNRAPIPQRRGKAAKMVDRAPRRVTMNDAQPMLLRTSIPSTFTPYAQGHSRSISLDANKSSKRTSTSSARSQGSTRHTSKLSNAVALAAVEEDTSIANSQISKPVFSTSDSSDPSAIGRVSTLPPSAFDGSSTSLQAISAPLTEGLIPGEGFATIYTSKVLRSKAEILAGMADVQLPSYALDLMEDLDFINDHIPLQTSAPSSSVPTGATTASTAPSAWGSYVSTPATPPSAASAPLPIFSPKEPKTPSRKRSLRSLGGLSPTRSLLRKSNPSTPSPTKRNQSIRPLSSLGPIDESTSRTASALSSARSSMISLQFSRARNENTTNTAFISGSTSQVSQSQLTQSSPSRLGRHFSFLGRK